MNFIRTAIPDVVIIEPKVHGDERGYFVETFRADKLEEFLGYKINFCQDNESKSSRGVLRGLHYQLAPFAQTKLVRVISGSVLDVAVDIRKGSPWYGKYVIQELSEEKPYLLWIPPGFAHGFQALEDNTLVLYLVTKEYSKEYEACIKWNDPELGIEWPFKEDDVIISEKDQKCPLFKEANINFVYVCSSGIKLKNI